MKIEKLGRVSLWMKRQTRNVPSTLRYCPFIFVETVEVGQQGWSSNGTSESGRKAGNALSAGEMVKLKKEHALGAAVG